MSARKGNLIATQRVKNTELGKKNSMLKRKKILMLFMR